MGSDSDFAGRYEKMAVIAGGSEGVGASYAHLLAERGLDLLLIARKAEALSQLRAELAQRFPARDILLLSADLTQADSIEQIKAHTADREVGMLICNAGSCTTTRPFVDNDLDFAQKLVALNATTPMALAHHFGRGMKARGRGGIILIGSLAYMAGNPNLAAYSAAKAFSASLAETLWFELGQHGVDVLGHILGSTDTPAMARLYPQAVGLGEKPDDVAQAGLAYLGKGPILRAPGGDDFYQHLASLSRAEAVQAMAASGALYQDS